MEIARRRKERLHQLLEWAMSCRGLSKTQFAKALGYHRSWVYPETDNPKMDLIVRLRDLLDWSSDQIIDFITAGLSPAIPPAGDLNVSGLSFDEIAQMAGEAYRAGEQVKSLHYASKLHEMAQTPAQRAEAYNRESIGWDGLGRYTKSLEAERQGLREPAIPTELRLTLEANLAGSYYTLLEPSSAHGLARTVLEWFDYHKPTTTRERETQAFAYYIAVSVAQQLAWHDPRNAEFHAQNAVRNLARAIDLYCALARDASQPNLEGVANTCRAGILEAEVALGRRKADIAVAELLDGLPAMISGDDAPMGDWLESYGWWCVCGASIALRYLRGADLQRAMAVFTQKLLDIADETDNWAFRERALRAEYELRSMVARTTGYVPEYTLDIEELRSILGVMGRFPGFQPLGWEILNNSRLVKDDDRE